VISFHRPVTSSYVIAARARVKSLYPQGIDTSSERRSHGIWGRRVRSCQSTQLRPWRWCEAMNVKRTTARFWPRALHPVWGSLESASEQEARAVSSASFLFSLPRIHQRIRNAMYCCRSSSVLQKKRGRPWDEAGKDTTVSGYPMRENAGLAHQLACAAPHVPLSLRHNHDDPGANPPFGTGAGAGRRCRVEVQIVTHVPAKRSTQFS